MLKYQKKSAFLTLAVAAVSMLSFSAHADDRPDPMGRLTKYSEAISKATGHRLFMSGYANGHYMNHDGVPAFVGKNINGPLWQIREASLFFDFMLTDDLLFSTELEVSYDFSNQDVSGRDRRLEALLDYYYLDFDVSSAFDWDTDRTGNLSVRAGRILVPFLSYNENKPNFRQSLMSQPFTAWQLAPVNNVASGFEQFGWSDLGATLGWDYTIEDAGIIDFKFSALNGLGTPGPVLDSNTVQLDPPGANPTVRPRDGLVNARSSWDNLSDNNDSKAFAVKASFAPANLPVDIGVSWYSGEWDDDDDHNLSMYGMHLNYIEKDWSIKGEYVKADVEQTAGINPVTAAGPAAVNTSTDDYQMKAWYLEGAYIPYSYEGCSGLYSEDECYIKLIARYDSVDTNDKASFTPFDRSRVTLGTEWKFLNNTRLRYEWSKNTLHDFERAPAPYVAAGGKEHIYMNMISIIANF